MKKRYPFLIIQDELRVDLIDITDEQRKKIIDTDHTHLQVVHGRHEEFHDNIMLFMDEYDMAVPLFCGSDGHLYCYTDYMTKKDIIDSFE